MAPWLQWTFLMFKNENNFVFYICYTKGMRLFILHFSLDLILSIEKEEESDRD